MRVDGGEMHGGQSDFPFPMVLLETTVTLLGFKMAMDWISVYSDFFNFYLHHFITQKHHPKNDTPSSSMAKRAKGAISRIQHVVNEED